MPEPRKRAEVRGSQGWEIKAGVRRSMVRCTASPFFRQVATDRVRSSIPTEMSAEVYRWLGQLRSSRVGSFRPRFEGSAEVERLIGRSRTMKLISTRKRDSARGRGHGWALRAKSPTTVFYVQCPERETENLVRRRERGTRSHSSHGSLGCLSSFCSVWQR